MTKKLGVFTAAIILFAVTGQAGAFLVYNSTDTDIFFEQTSGGTFTATLHKGENGGCEWTSTGCNTTAKQDSQVGIAVKNAKSGEQICKETISADGKLYVFGKSGKYSCGPTAPVGFF